MSEQRQVPGPTSGVPLEALACFEAHLPLLERVIAQLLGGGPASVRDLIYLGAAVLLRAAVEWQAANEPESVAHDGVRELSFAEFAEVTLTGELLHHLHYPVPLLRLPAELVPFLARLNAMARSLAALHVRPTLALATYPAFALRHQLGAGHPEERREWGTQPATTLWKIFKKRVVAIAALIVVTEVGIAAYTLHAPKTWVAYSTLNSGIGTKDPLGGGGDWFTQGTIVANITELLKSRTVLENTIAALALPTTPEKLGDRLTISRMGQAGLLKVEAEAEAPQAAGELVNTLVREFLRYYASSQSHDARSNKAFFEGQVRAAQSRLHMAEARLKTFKGTNVPEMQANVPARVGDLIAQRDEAARNLAAAQAGLAVVQRELGAIKHDPLLAQRIFNSGAVMTATEKLRDLQMNLNDAREIYGDASPVVKNLRSTIARAKSQLRTTTVDATEQNPALADATARVIQLRTDIAMNGARLASLNRTLATIQPQARAASSSQVTYEQLQREVRIAETQYLDLQTKFGQSNLVVQSAGHLNISVVDAAIPPKEPLSSKLLLKLILGLLFGLGLGLFISYLISLREPAEAEAEAPRVGGRNVTTHFDRGVARG